MPLILQTDEFHGAAERLQPGNHLFCLADWYPRVVRPMDHQQRGTNLFNVVDRRDLREKVAVVFEAAVLSLAQVPPPGPGVLEERHEVGDANQVYAGRP